ncbi:MAG TPA: Nif3-like dinuclear metal center hexameric protein [Thiotrichales bacterium]|nr:Nif3-like dinuclear metal center hexameric protein [Thiotrichales bacterium]
MAELNAIVEYANELLKINQFKDYCPNGLQVEGRAQVKKIISGVTACQALIDAATQEQADVLLVHHGYFWRSEDASITGIKLRRIKALLDNSLSLLAYHLPLDAHVELGNNVSLAARLGFQTEGVLTSELIGNYGSLAQPLDADGLASRISTALGREPLVIPAGPEKIQRIGWCTGAAQNYIDQAIRLELDAYISGEISEQTVHQAREAGIHYFAAGHHATERYGVQSLGEHLAQHFDVSHQFIDIDNPV